MVATNRVTAKTAFLFTGQGAQVAGMGRGLYATSATFRSALDRCAALYAEYTGESLLDVVYPAEAGDERIDDTTYTQPALFALEYALAQLWQSWGIQPDLLLGHSVGEVVAACVAGVFSLEDAVRLVAARGRLMGRLPRDGAMVAVMAGEGLVQAALAVHGGAVAIAAINGPHSTVISGEREAVAAVAAGLAAQGVKSRELAVSHAFHSPLMEPILDDFRQVAQGIGYHTTPVAHRLQLDREGGRS